MSEDDLLEELDSWVERCGQAFVAAECGVSQSCISQIVNGHTPIGPSVFLAMGYRRVVSFEPIAQRPAEPSSKAEAA